MHVQLLSSGSEGNALVVRAGELSVLLDAGLGVRALGERFAAAGLGPRAIDHVLVSHAHLDHSRSAGAVAKRQDAVLHVAPSLQRIARVARAPRLASLPVGGAFELASPAAEPPLVVRTAPLHHDCEPTVAFRFEHAGRRLAVATDLGRSDPGVVSLLSGVHVLVLEFNHDPGLLAASEYPPELQRRIGGERGHLSNEDAARLLERVADEDLHTLVLAHLSRRTNTPELALSAARRTLERLGLTRVEVLVASQHEIGPNLPV